MSHLGLTSAAAAMARGFRTVCFDEDAAMIEALSKGALPVSEPGLDDAMRENAANAEFTAQAADLNQCDVVYVSIDVETDDAGQSDISRVQALIDAVSKALRHDAILVLLSQVPPGFTRNVTMTGARLYCQVETLIYGEALHRALHPERFIVGCADPLAPLPAAYQSFLAAFGCPILPMRYESAELAKIAINCCLAASISVANTLAELCEHTGANWSEIAPAVKLDKRIGQHAYLRPGLGIGGGNLERDLATVIRLADELGTDAGVVRAWVANSDYRRDWALRTLYREVLCGMDDPVIAVLGLAYKAGTASIRNSPAMALLHYLSPYQVRIFDPAVTDFVVPDTRWRVAGSGLDACAGANVLMVMTPWPQFKDLDPAAIRRNMRGTVVIDPYTVLNVAACQPAGLRYLALGMETLNGPSE